jgi:hypothetical protein
VPVSVPLYLGVTILKAAGRKVTVLSLSVLTTLNRLVLSVTLVSWLIVFIYDYLKLVRIRTANCALLRVNHEFVQIG